MLREFRSNEFFVDHTLTRIRGLTAAGREALGWRLPGKRVSLPEAEGILKRADGLLTRGP